MPLDDYDDNTFVAFVDISGFKMLMKKEKGWQALDSFYSIGYRSLQNHLEVQGFFVSDCGILFVRTNQLQQGFLALLTVIKELNMEMAQHDYLLTCSIAYGAFKYRNKIEFTGIEKNSIYGNAYLSALLDSEEANPKIEPTQCRIVKENFPFTLDALTDAFQNNRDIQLLKEKTSDRKHYYYYWMVRNPLDIEHYETMFKDAYQLKYAGILKASKTFVFERE